MKRRDKIGKILCGSTTAVVTLILGFIWWVFNYDTLVPIWVLAIVILVSYIICVFEYAYYSTKTYEAIYQLPKVKKILKNDKDIILIVEGNSLFGQGTYATVYYQNEKEELETVIGLGYVQTINNAGNMQIIIEKTTKNANPIVNKLQDCKVDRASILIKPSIHKRLLVEE